MAVAALDRGGLSNCFEIYDDAPSNKSRSTPVLTPIPSSIYTTSSVATFPLAPGAYGQPPRPDTDVSNTVMP